MCVCVWQGMSRGLCAAIKQSTVLQHCHQPTFHHSFLFCSTFYEDTTDRNWGSAYLKPEFFCMLGDGLADQVSGHILLSCTVCAEV